MKVFILFVFLKVSLQCSAQTPETYSASLTEARKGNSKVWRLLMITARKSMFEEISMEDIMENVFMKKTQEMGYDDFNTDRATIYFKVKEGRCLMTEKSELYKMFFDSVFDLYQTECQYALGVLKEEECPESGWDGVLLNDCETSCQVLGNLATVLKYPTVSFGCTSPDYSNIKRLK